MTRDLHHLITERLDALAESTPASPPAERAPLRRVRRDDFGVGMFDGAARRAPERLRPIPTVAKSDKPVPREARDLEGRYADAPDHLAPEGMRSVARLCILSVEWGGFGNRTLRVTGRNVATKNILITAVEDLTNIGDSP